MSEKSATAGGLETTFLMELHAKLQPPIDAGEGPEGHRMVFLAAEGWFDGPRLKGRVVPLSGGDWARLRPDGSVALDVRACLETDDGAVIYTTYGGRILAPDADAMAFAMDFGKEDDPESASRYYFRTNPLFETGHEKYAWLNGVVAVGVGRTGAGGVTYRIYQVD